jgi:hypothetical protein
MDRETKYDRSIRQTSCMTEQDYEKVGLLLPTMQAMSRSGKCHGPAQSGIR